MKQIETYFRLGDYYESIENHKHAIMNVSKVGDIRNEEYYYDRIVLTSGSNLALYNIATGNGWNYTSNSGVTKSELSKLLWVDLIGCFSNNTALTTFDEFKYFTGVTYIPADLFEGCTGINEITIPKNVKTIEPGAFDSFPSSVKINYEGNFDDIDFSQISSCIIKYSGLTSASTIFAVKKNQYDSDVPYKAIIDSIDGFIKVSGNNGTQIIRTTVLSGTVGDQIDTSSSDEFYITYYLKKPQLPYAMFSGCSSITEFSLSNIVEFSTSGASEPSYAFAGCSKIVEANIPTNFKNFGGHAFNSCSALERINIPDGITKLGRSIFYRTKLTGITLPNSLTYIGDSCFEQTKITEITIPESVSYVGQHAFDSCTELSVIYANPKTVPSGWSSSYCYIFQGIKSGGTIYYPANSVYTAWTSNSSYKLGYYGWNAIAFNPSVGASVISVTYNVTSTTQPTQILSSSFSAIGFFKKAELDGGAEINIGSAYTFPAIGQQTINYTLIDGCTNLADKMFAGCGNILSVMIPEGVSKIGNECFSACTNLASITLPNSLNTIGGSAFTKCESLTSITFPNNLETIGGCAFFVSNLPASLVIPDSVSRLGNSAFTYCSGLTSVIIGSGLTGIPNYCFASASSLSSVTMADSVESIGYYAFDKTPYKDSGYCYSENGIYYPNNTIAWYAKDRTRESYEFRVGTKSISNSCMVYCENATAITIPDGVLKIGSSAFEHCSSLTGITIPDSVETIGRQPFYGNRQMTTVTVGSGLKEIPEHFLRWSSVADFIMPDTVKSIADAAFYGADSLTSVTISSGVSFIPASAFTDCHNLVVCQIPSTVTGFGRYAFAYCGLSSFTIPDSVTQVGVGCFYNCSNLLSITFTSGMKTVPEFVLANCTALTSVTIPDNYEEIGTGTGGLSFDGCSSLKHIVLPRNLKSIYTKSFEDCISLEEIVIPEKVTELRSECFNNCSSITAITINSTGNNLSFSASCFCGVTLYSGNFVNNSSWNHLANKYGGARIIDTITPEGLSIIGNTLLSCAKDATSVIIPPEVTILSANCFSGCVSLTAVNFSDEIQGLEKSGIETTPYIISGYCPSYGNIYYPNNVIAFKAVNTSESNFTFKPTTKRIANGCFKNCASLTALTVPDSIISIASDAFDGTPYIASGYCPSYGNIYYPNNKVAYKAVSVSGTNFETKDGTETISDCAFYNCNSATAITIADGITEIGELAFYGCELLNDFILPNSVVKLGKDFLSGAGPVNIVIGDGVSSVTKFNFTVDKRIRNRLQKIVLGNGVLSLPEGVFRSYGSLREIVVGASIKSLPYRMFAYNSSLQSIKILSPYAQHDQYWFDSNGGSSCPNNGVLYYPNGCFKHYSGWVSDNYYLRGKNWREEPFYPEEGNEPVITATYNVTGTSNTALLYNGLDLSLIEKMEIDGIGEITPVSSYTFQTTGLTTIHYTLNSTVLPESMFSGNTSIISVNIGNGCEAICSSSFGYCTKLSSVTIPETVSLIGDSCFYRTYALTDITLSSKVAIGDSAFYRSGTKTFDFTKVTKLGVYSFAYSQITDANISYGPTTIPHSAFESCPNLSSVTIPNSVTGLGYECFYGCKNLQSVIIPDSVTTYLTSGYSRSGYCFASCYGLTSVTLSKNMSTLPASMFRSCSSLTQVTIPKVVTGIYDNCFNSCSSLTSLTFENGSALKTISPYVLMNCVSLESVIIPESVTSIYTRAFDGCSSLTSVSFTLANKLTSLGENIFNGCAQLTAITLPNSLTYDWGYAFRGNQYIKQIVLGENTTLSTNYSGYFSGCTALTGITLPDSVSALPGYTFVGCSSLQYVICGNGIKTVGDKCFSGCSSLTSVTFGTSTSEFGLNVLDGCKNISRITCNAINAPVIQANTFANVGSNGTLYYPSGSNYTKWLGTDSKYLGYYGWTGQEMP